MSLDRQPYLKIRDDDQKRLREQFSDNRIYFGLNIISGEMEAWYKPLSSAPYKITAASNVAHACKLLGSMKKYETMRAKDILKEIDEHNDDLIEGKEADAMMEVRHDLKRIASGRQYFTVSSPARRRF